MEIILDTNWLACFEWLVQVFGGTMPTDEKPMGRNACGLNAGGTESWRD